MDLIVLSLTSDWRVFVSMWGWRRCGPGFDCGGWDLVNLLVIVSLRMGERSLGTID